MDMISSATVTLPLEEFDKLREAANEREAERLKNRIAACISADFEAFKAELEKIDKSSLDTPDKEIDRMVAEATRKIEFTIDRKAAISLFIDYAAFKKSGDYDGYLGEADKGSLKKSKITFK